MREGDVDHRERTHGPRERTGSRESHRRHGPLLIALVAVVIAATASPRALAMPRVQPALPTGAIDTSAVPDEDVSAIAQQLNCPTCEGYNLRDCPLTVCAQMRGQIRERLAAGVGEAAIIEEFVGYYGPQVLNAPPKRGLFLLAWWLPPAVLLLASLGVGTWGWRQRGRGTTQTINDAERPIPPAVDAGQDPQLGSTDARRAGEPQSRTPSSSRKGASDPVNAARETSANRGAATGTVDPYARAFEQLSHRDPGEPKADIVNTTQRGTPSAAGDHGAPSEPSPDAASDSVDDAVSGSGNGKTPPPSAEALDGSRSS